VNISVTASQNSVCVNDQTTLTATGASNYTWSSGSTNSFALVSPSATAYYKVQGTVNGCGDKDSILITAIPLPVSILSLTPPSCNGSCNGAIQVMNTQGVGPFTYQLSNPTCTSAVCPSLCAGAYTLTVKGALGCTMPNTFTLSQPAVLQTSSTFTNATCTTCGNGSASVTATGGTLPYTYLWAPMNVTTAAVTTLNPGCYTVTVTDANNCSTSTSMCIGGFTGLKELISVNAVRIFPNPAHDQINVKIDSEKFDCYLYNELGQIIRFAEGQNETVSLTVAGLAKGIYYLEARVGDQRIMQKVIID